MKCGCGLGSSGTEYEQVFDSYEQGNELSGSINDGEFHSYLRHPEIRSGILNCSVVVIQMPELVYFKYFTGNEKVSFCSYVSPYRL
jgi:hypothetical protein